MNIDTERFLVFNVSFLNLEKSVLGIETRVLGKSPGNNKESVSESLDAELNLTRNSGSRVVMQVFSTCNFKGTSTGNDALIFNSVLDGTETITDSITGLGNGVIVGALNEDSAGERVFDTFNKSVLVFSEDLFVDNLGETNIGNV